MGLPTFHLNYLSAPLNPLKHLKKFTKKPLETYNDGWANFGSLKGRGACVVKLGEYILNVATELVSLVGRIVSTTARIFRLLLTLPFYREDCINNLDFFTQAFAESLGSLLATPFVAVSDIGKLLIGATVHPGVAIAKR